MSTRQQIVDAVLTALVTIKTANNFNSNAGRNVKELSDTPVTTFPALRVADTTAEVVTDGVEIGFHQHQMQLTVVAFETTREKAREIVEDVVALMFDNRKWSGLARWTQLDRHEIEEQQADRKFVAATMQFTITYRTALGAI